ncbi:E3 ubiquitin-protein ligase SNT2, partial [Dissostichus eleginoides]
SGNLKDQISAGSSVMIRGPPRLKFTPLRFEEGLCPEWCIAPSPHQCSLLSVCVYRPYFGMEKRLPSTQNQWLLFSLLQRPPVIWDEYKAHIVLFVSLSGIIGGAGRRRWQISGGRPAGPS